jgi:hypothetical protein
LSLAVVDLVMERISFLYPVHVPSLVHDLCLVLFLEGLLKCI